MTFILKNFCCRSLYTYQNISDGQGSNRICETTLDTVGMTSTTFHQILDYIYTSVIVLNDDNIQVSGPWKITRVVYTFIVKNFNKGWIPSKVK